MTRIFDKGFIEIKYVKTPLSVFDTQSGLLMKYLKHLFRTPTASVFLVENNGSERNPTTAEAI